MNDSNKTPALTLFVRNNCHWSEQVREKLGQLGLLYTERNIIDQDAMLDLLELGGIFEVPFFVDATNAMHLYEARDIIAYLEKMYGKGEVALPEANA